MMRDSNIVFHVMFFVYPRPKVVEGTIFQTLNKKL